MFKPFTVMPMQAVEAYLAGIVPYDGLRWSDAERAFFKQFVKKCNKGLFVFGMLAKPCQDVIGLDKISLILIDPARAELARLRACCINYQMIKKNLALLDQSTDEFTNAWNYYEAPLRSHLKKYGSKSQKDKSTSLDSYK